MILIVVLPLENNGGRLAGYYMANCATVSLVALLSLISTNVAGYTKKTTVAALFLIAYCTGNIIGMIISFQVTTSNANKHRIMQDRNFSTLKNHHVFALRRSPSLVSSLTFRCRKYLMTWPKLAGHLVLLISASFGGTISIRTRRKLQWELSQATPK